jgi:NAD-dependent dihydropyrimidine dehydrogenase PreA subunit
MIREIVIIDENKCDGCGLCIPACHEGALKIIDGKARVVADQLCDGMGACLGHCPRGAIRIEKREADAFDEAVVREQPRHLPPASAGAPRSHPPRPATPAHSPAQPSHHSGGCPGSRLMQFAGAAPPPHSPAPPPTSELTHWPVQLRLLPPQAPVLRGARLLIAADCVPVAYPDFQNKLLRGRAVLIGCPKFDDLPACVEKLTQIIQMNSLAEIVVARMEVPCCGGLLQAVLAAREQAGSQVPVTDVVVGVRGDVLAWQPVPVRAASAD